MMKQPDPALLSALKRKQNFDDGGEVGESDDNAGIPIPTKASAAADTLQPLSATPSASNSGSVSNSGGGAMQMPGQSQFGKLPSAEVPTFPKINLVSNAYLPQMRALPTPQARQQASIAALQPFINALAQLKARQQ